MNPIIEFVAENSRDLSVVVSFFIGFSCFMLADTLIKKILQGEKMIYSCEDPELTVEMVKLCNREQKMRAKCYYSVSLFISIMISLFYYINQ